MTGGILLLGGHSDIGTELTTRLCAGRPVVLAARRPHTLDAITQRLHDAGATHVHALPFEATDLHHHRTLITEATNLVGPITTAILAYGILGDHHRATHDETHTADIATINYTAQITMLTALADTMSHGEIITFSSIAGWRARKANYIYGSTKAGLDAFCQGLADHLHHTNLRLITARPGFVIGSMTEGMTPAPLAVTPTTVATAITHEIHHGTTSTTLWIPRQLQLLAWAMRLTPRPLWRTLRR